MATVVVSPATPAGILVMSARIVEAGAGTYIAQFVIPPGGVLFDVIATAEALWTAATSAALIIGDTVDDDGYVASTDLKATDLTAGQSISIGGGLATQGGKGGAFVTVGTNTHLTNKIPAAAGQTVVAKVVSVGAGTAGRTRVDVLYYAPGPTPVGP